MGMVLDWLSTTASFGSTPTSAPLIAVRFAADLCIALSYLAISAGIAWFLWRRPDVFREYRMLAGLWGAFVFATGLTDAIDVLARWHPVGAWGVVVAVATAVIALATVLTMWPLLPYLLRIPSRRQLAEMNDRLRQEVAAHAATLQDLESARRELESRVEERTREANLLKARFETALRGGNVHAFSQDRDLRYTWVYSPHDESVAEMIGRTDHEVLPASERDEIIALKQKVIQTGMPQDCEVSYLTPHGRARFALHVEPAFGPDGKVDGITGAAIDISPLRSLESEQRRLAEELRTALQRYDIALRGSHVTVFTQDRELRYTSISNSLFGRAINEIVGRTDDDLLAPESREVFAALKREVFASGQPQGGEIGVKEGAQLRWYDVHIEPLPSVTGDIIGLAGAAVDVTERKEGEAHLRLLMRELTHRSKNLLAVIQAMARQTARHAGTTERFLDQFSARLQALATSHDLLVRGSWHGASLSDLARLQLGPYLDRSDSPVSIDGPPILLKPEAAQSLGLALHELATNAAKYGSLSVPRGRVAITWRRAKEPGGVEILWAESQGPSVNGPVRRGFGSLVVEQNLARSLDADVDLKFAPDGVHCRILIPANHLLDGR
jgi:PAS domain S-box-containing protein